MKTKIIYIRTTENCNIHCQHCFVPHKKNFMSFETFKQIIKIINEKFGQDKHLIQLIFHGGEPTLIGEDWIENAIEYTNRNINKNIEIEYQIQTNLINYNEKWKKIYQKYFNYIGISYDFNIRKINKSNSEFEKVFWQNFNKLKGDNIKFNMIITVTKHLLNIPPHKFLDWLYEKEIYNLHLERLSKTGYAEKNWSKIGFTNKEYNDYMYMLFKLWFNDYKTKKGKDKYINISNFMNMIEYIPQKKSISCAGKCSNFFTFLPNGEIAGCTATLNKIGDIANYKDILEKNKTDIRENCINCEYFNVCNGGCPSNLLVFDESNECLGNYRLLKYVDNITKIFKENFELSNKKIFEGF